MLGGSHCQSAVPSLALMDTVSDDQGAGDRERKIAILSIFSCRAFALLILRREGEATAKPQTRGNVILLAAQARKVMHRMTIACTI